MIDCIFLIKFVQTKNIMGFYNIPKDTLDTFTEMLNNEQLGAVMRYSLTGAPEGDIADKLVLFAVTLLRKNLKTSEKEEEKEIKSKSKSEINRENAKKRWHANDATACEYANDANRISHKIELDTTIYRPWSEIHLIVNDSIIIDYLTRSELMVTFGVQKYDNHKSWIGRLLHRDKKRKVAHVSETNPHIILEQSEFIENENDD